MYQIMGLITGAMYQIMDYHRVPCIQTMELIGKLIVKCYGFNRELSKEEIHEKVYIVHYR